MNLDAARTTQAHDPDQAGSSRQQVRNLVSQRRLVLARIGILQRQQRCSWHPAGHSGYFTHRHIRRAQGAGFGSKAGIHTRLGDGRVAGQHYPSQQIGERPTSPAGQTQDSVTLGKLIGIPRTQIFGLKGSLRRK